MLTITSYGLMRHPGWNTLKNGLLPRMTDKDYGCSHMFNKSFCSYTFFGTEALRETNLIEFSPLLVTKRMREGKLIWLMFNMIIPHNIFRDFYTLLVTASSHTFKSC